MLVGGEAGIGKTALVRALAAEAAAHGAAVLIGGCYDLSVTPPYGPWRELLARLPSGDGLPPLPSALTDAGAPEPGGEAALFRQVHDLLAAVAATRPVVAVLEDLHWADPASLDLLRYLGPAPGRPSTAAGRHLPGRRTDPAPPPRPPAAGTRAGVASRAARSAAPGRGRATVAGQGQVPAARGGRARLVAYLERIAEGNPFYAQELLRSLEEERVLRPGEPRWTLGNLEQVRVPVLLRQVVEGRLARLGEAAREQLAVASVIGQRVPLAVWQTVGGLGEDEMLQTVERAVEARLLAADNDGAQVAFAHALVREVLYEGILPPRRRVWHRRVAEATADLPTPDPDAVAYHFAQAGDARAAAWLVRAGERALRAYAWLTARDRFAAAVALLEGDAARASERGWLLYRLGRLLRLSDPGQGVEYLEKAESIARSIGDPLLAAYALADRGLLLCILAQVERGVESLEAGVAALEALPADQARPDPAIGEWIADALPAMSVPNAAGDTPPATGALTARRGTLASWLGHTGRFAEARAMGEAYLAQAAGTDRPDALAVSGIGEAEFAVALAEAALGHPTAARAAWRRAQAAFRAIDHHFVVGLALGFELTEVVLPYYTTDVAARRALVAEARDAHASYVLDLARAGGAVVSLADVRLHDMDVLVVEGAWAEADRLTHAAFTAHPLHRLQPLVGLAVLARWRGDPAEAWGHLTAVLPRGLAAEPGSYPFRYATAVQRLAADLALDAGDLPAASAWLAAHDAWLAWSGAVRGQAEGRRLWARYHRVAGDPDRAREQGTEAVALATAPHQPLALLAAHRLLGEIGTENSHWEEAESHLCASLALADACAAPFERALTLLALADLRAAEGKIPEATRLLAEVRAVGEPLGAAPLLARADALAARLAARPAAVDAGPRLSAREVEVLRLVAAGRSNPEIAGALFVSPRTVTTHLTHIFAKLGVEGRAEAVALAVRRGLI